jgi:FkbM family methyltransferase
MFKNIMRGVLARVGYEIRRKPVHSPLVTTALNPAPVARQSFEGALGHLVALGWQPQTIIDVGAATGEFTRTCLKFFPQAAYVLVEPLSEHWPSLEPLLAQPARIELVKVAAGDRAGPVTFNVHPDRFGSSLYQETEGPHVDGMPREVPMQTLDSIFASRQYSVPCLLKIDVQGAEREVLAGANDLLESVDYVILEVSLFEFHKNGPQLLEIVALMDAPGFVVYDLLDTLYRPLDGALAQIDLAFVKKSGEFRRHHYFATAEQRNWQNQHLTEFFSPATPSDRNA